MTELDEMLRGSFARIAEPGDPAGVVAAIQSRVDSGDTGTPADSSGFGGGGFSPWLPWIGLVVVAGIVGGVAGVSGVAGRPTVEVATIGYSALLDERVDVLACPGGDSVGTLVQGERVLAIARSDDSAYLAVRDPYDSSATVWLPRAAVVVDNGEQDVASLPVDGCDEVIVTTPTPTPTPTETPEPGPAPKPVPTKDTAAPVMGQSYATPNPIYNLEPTVVHATAADNVGVVSISISWAGEFTGSAQMTKSGAEWVYTFTPPDDNGGTITFTLRAIDAAGNQSGPATVNVDHQYFG